MANKNVDVLQVIIDAQTKKAHAGFKAIEEVMDDIDFGIQKANKSAKQMSNLQQGLMGAGLSFLFTGMAIKNMFQNALNGLLSTYIMVSGENSAIAESINNLKARWLFFLTTLGETGILDKWIEKVDRILKFFTDMPEPVKELIVNGMVLGFILGTVLMVVGQIMLGVLGLIVLFATGLAVPMFLISAILFGILILVGIWSSDLNIVVKVLLTIIIIIGILIALSLLGVAPWVLIVIVIVGLIALFVKFRKHIMLGFLKIGQAVQDYFLLRLMKVVDILNAIIAKFNQLTGKKFNKITISENLGFDFGSKIAALEADIAGSKSQPSMVDRAREGVTNIKNEINVEGSVVHENYLKDLMAQTMQERQSFDIGSPQLQ